MTTTTALGKSELEHHEHEHAQNRFAVIPTPLRLNADTARTGKGVTIAFLDSGFYPHPDLTEPVDRIIAFEDVSGLGAPLTANNRPQGWDWHGTQTTVAACGNGYMSTGVYRGLASDARLVLVKASAQGKITEETIARGIRWVIENKDRYDIRILSISLGGDGDAPYRESQIDQAAEEAVARGITVVAAAGNSGCAERYTTVPPANSPSVITVGGYDDKNLLGNQDYDLYCSSYGATIDGHIKPEIIAPAIWIAAPILPKTEAYKKAEALSQIAAAPDYQIAALARDLWRQAGLPGTLSGEAPDQVRAAIDGLLRENKIVATHYQHVDGTSFAAPIVSSVVAQMLEANPKLSPAAVKDILISTADRIAGAPVARQGYGVLNARAAVERAARETHSLDQAEIRPPQMIEGKLVFLYHDDAARSVSLAGDFNQWNPTGAQLARGAYGIWRAEIDALPPGRYRYKFVIDESRWMEDPRNTFKEPDQYGGLNSVLTIN
jgi:serine protease AprX